MVSEHAKPEKWAPAADETGDEQPFGVFESAEARVSEPNADITDVGDWLSCSETVRCGDLDLISWSIIVGPFTDGAANFRG